MISGKQTYRNLMTVLSLLFLIGLFGWALYHSLNTLQPFGVWRVIGATLPLISVLLCLMFFVRSNIRKK